MKKKQSAREERLFKQMKEVKFLLENTSLCSQRNDLEREMNKCNLSLEKTAQKVENMYRESSRRLQKKECALETYKKKLKEGNKRVEESTQQLQSEKQDNKRLRRYLEVAESNAKEQVKDTEHESNQLRKLLKDSDGNAEHLNRQVKTISKELEDAKNALAQREIRNYRRLKCFFVRETNYSICLGRVWLRYNKNWRRQKES